MLAAKGRFAITTGGVAAAVMLLTFVLALYQGWNSRLTAYLDGTDADLWVVQRGNESFFSPSVVNVRNEELVANTEGVDKSSSLTGRTLRMQHEGGEFDIYVMGFEADRDGLGGPLDMKEGERTPKEGEIVIDEVLARAAGVGIGETINAGIMQFKVVGISKGGNLGITFLCFVTEEDANRLIGGYPIVTYILIKGAPDKHEAIIANIERQNPSMKVWPQEEFADSSKQVLRRSLLPVLLVVVVLVVIVGSVIVGSAMYTATIEKEREFGVMKALGAPGWRMARVVVQQSVVCSLLGFLVGVAAALVAARLVVRLVPQFVTLVRPVDVLAVLVATIGIGIIAAMIPLRRILRVDPLVVFKA